MEVLGGTFKVDSGGGEWSWSCWESVKIILRKVLGRAKLNFEEMCIILTEAEALISWRPLTYVYNDVDESQPLTLVHFLVGLGGLTCLLPNLYY